MRLNFVIEFYPHNIIKELNSLGVVKILHSKACFTGANMHANHSSQSSWLTEMPRLIT